MLGDQPQILFWHIVVHEIKNEAEKPKSLLDCARFEGKPQVHNLSYNSIDVLKELERLFSRYQSLGTTQKRSWDRVGFALGLTEAIQDRIASHTSALNLWVASLGTNSLGRIEKKLDDLAAQVRAG